MSVDPAQATNRIPQWSLGDKFRKVRREVGLSQAEFAAQLGRNQRPRGQAHPIPDRDLRAALLLANEPIRTWLILGAFMGLRAMEIAQLRRDSVHDVDGRIAISGVGKGAKPFNITVPRYVEPYLRAHLGSRDHLWETPTGLVPGPQHVSQLVARFFHGQGMPYTMHWARHSFGTEAYKQSKDLLLVQELMRHSSSDNTQIYVQTSRPQAVAAMDQLSRSLRKRKPSARTRPALVEAA